MLTIIGIDPGLASTGIGIVKGIGDKIDSYSFGSINTSKTTSLSLRLDHIFSTLYDVLNKEKPHVMVVEDIFSLKQYPASGINLGKVTGVILLAGAKAGVTSLEISVREAKQILTGNGNASKKQLEKSVRHLLNHPEPIKPDHASDAMALAVIGLYRHDDYVKGRI